MTNQDQVTSKIICALKHEIDAIDRELIELVRQRALMIAQIKKLRESSSLFRSARKALLGLRRAVSFFLIREKSPVVVPPEAVEVEEVI